MIQRGRKAAAASPVVIQGGFSTRPEPPEDLTERQAEIWRGVAASEDARLFGTAATRNLLADYCRRRDTAETLSIAINQFKPEWLKDDAGVRRYKSLLTMRDREVSGATTLATKLRLTNQSRMDEQKVNTISRGAVSRAAKPWEI